MDWRWLNVVGLLFDIAGAFLTVRAVIVTGREAVELAATKWGANPSVAADRLRQSRLAQWGLALLVTGFALQAVGSWPR